MSQETQNESGTTHLENALDEAVTAVRIQTSQLEQLESGKPTGDPLGLDGLRDVPLPVTIELGRTRLPLQELLGLAAGSLVTLERAAHEPADIYVGGKLFARGEIVTVGEKYGIRVTSVP